MCYWKALLFLCFFLPEDIATATEPTFVLPHRGCYYASWSTYRQGKAHFLPRHIDASLCTIIYYAFAEIHFDSTVDANAKPTFGPVMKPNGSPYSNVSLSVLDTAAQLRFVKRRFPDIKLILSIGGWGAVDRINAIAASSDLRRIFISSAISMVRSLNYDGLDLSWEFPAKQDQSSATSLFTEIRSAIDAEANSSGQTRLIFTAAVGNSTIGGYNIPQLIKSVDLLNLMTYDIHNPEFEPTETGHQSQLYAPFANASSPNVKDFAEAWERAGAPKSKINIGLPMYGDTWNLTDPNKFGLMAPAKGKGPSGFHTQTPGFLAYYEICGKIRSGELVTTLQPDIKTPFAHSSNGNWWVSYDDAASLREKIRWIISKGYGGSFVWDITFDDFLGSCGIAYPLLNAIKSEYKV